jgi:hypothetical protein
VQVNPTDTDHDGERQPSSNGVRTVPGREADLHEPETDVSASALKSCLDILKNEEVSVLFEKYVNRALCADSYKFLRDAVNYSNTNYASAKKQVNG